MKKLLIIAVSMFAVSAFAETTLGAAGTETKTAAASISGSNASIDSGAVTIGCLVNCSDTTQATRDAADASIAVATIQGQAARDVAATTVTVRNVPSVSGPALTTSNDTCMGSTSGSVNIAGLGIGGGTSWVDGNCKMLKNSRELWNMGMKAASLALMCTDAANREALELTGFVCPQTAKQKSADLKMSDTISPVTAKSPEPTDPFVRARLGLPQLASAK